MYNDHKIVIGIAPSRRDVFRYAVEVKNKMMPALKEMFLKCGDVEIVDIDGINEEGILVDNADVKKVADLFIQKKVDAVFMPHFNFGQEEAVAKLGRAVGKPVLLWGPRDERPPEGRKTDTQCGLFVSAKALSRHNVPFTYIENCWITDKVLEKGIEDFVAVANVIKTFREIRIGQVSVRPRQFLSVKVNESELLEKFGIEVVVLESTYATSCLDNILANRRDDIKKTIAEWEKQYDFSGLNPGKLENMAALELAILTLAEEHGCSVVSCECWHLFKEKLGIRTCFVFGDLTQRGLPVACETDIHGSITSALLLGATRMQTPTFLADLTIRHPTNDNAELLWHCGPFPGCLAKNPGRQKVMGDGLGWWELKHGPISVARFDADKGKYSLFAGEGRGVDGPYTDGNYVWFETDDWVKWEKKLIYGPYIHHIICAHGNYKNVMLEACKYLGDVTPDTV